MSLNERKPAFCELGYAEGAFALGIRKDAWTHLASYVCSPDFHMIRGYSDELRIAWTLPKAEPVGAFGFENALVPAEHPDPGWHAWQGRLSCIRNGNAPETKKLRALSSTFSILFDLLSIFENDRPKKAKRHQLMNIRMSVGNTMREMFIGGDLFPPVAAWLSNQPDNSHRREIEEAMKDATDAILGKQAWYWKEDFRALCRQPKYINLCVPGNACGLDPTDYSDDDPRRGYSLMQHNVDGLPQQFSLLAGLAKLQELVREEKP